MYAKVRTTKVPFPSGSLRVWRLWAMIGKYPYVSTRSYLTPQLHLGRCSHDTAVQIRFDWLARFTCLVVRTKHAPVA